MDSHNNATVIESDSAIVIGSAPGPIARLLPLGATLQELTVTCGDGQRRNVVLGYPEATDYLTGSDYRGATVGRYANRIENGRFILDGTPIQLTVNDRGNHLHGGENGFHRKTWTVEEHSERHALMSLTSAGGEDGYPGTLRATVKYSIEGSSLTIVMRATTDKPTIVNLTNHTYFNLDGEGTIDDHVLAVGADLYTPVDDAGIPIDGHAPVEGTRYDLRHPRLLRDESFDHNYVLSDSRQAAARLSSLRTRTTVDLHTDQPGLQIYTGEMLRGAARGGLALEPQWFPDTPNHPEFGSVRLAPGGMYVSSIRYTFNEVVPR
jgi:aldose 1-epimerase